VHNYVPHAWVGADKYFAMRKKLGLSNMRIFGMVIGITLLVTAGIIAWVVSQ
jgi:hypothetical protein